MPDLNLKLDAVHLTPMLTARIAERTQRILANDANRKALRKQADGKDGKAEKDAKDAALAAADAKKAAYDAAKDAAKSAHAATGAYAEELLDLGCGVLILREQAEVKVQGKPPVERKRLKLDDKDCDAFTASYVLSCAASDEAADLQRQVEAYKAAHPALFDLGEPPPVDPAYEALKVALAAKQATAQSEMEKQGALMQKYLAGETVTYYVGMRIESGEIVLGDREED